MCNGYFLGLELITLNLALHKDLNLSCLVFDVTCGLWSVHHVCDHVTFFVIAFLAQINSRTVVNCRTLLNSEKCISIHCAFIKEVDKKRNNMCLL